MMEESRFVRWLAEELDRRGWSFRELGRRAGVSSATISRVLSGVSRPGWVFCRKVAAALGVSPVRVFRLAGLLPPVREDEEGYEELLYLFDQLSPADRARFLVLLRGFVAEYGERRKGRGSR